jgi:CheY-like chemotaxis protein
LRARPSFAATLLIALSGYGRDEDKQRAFEAGFDHHCTKPVEIETVQALFASIGARETFGEGRPLAP